ncbi:hypothetical protein ACTWQJ_49660, partial [Streptomyces sp. KR55]
MIGTHSPGWSGCGADGGLLGVGVGVGVGAGCGAEFVGAGGRGGSVVPGADGALDVAEAAGGVAGGV